MIETLSPANTRKIFYIIFQRTRNPLYLCVKLDHDSIVKDAINEATIKMSGARRMKLVRAVCQLQRDVSQ